MEQGGAADPAVWSQLAGQLGLTGLIVGEEYGGAGSGFLDFALVAERTGAALLVAPLLSTVAAAGAIMLSCDEQLKSDYLPALAGGERIGTLALAEASASWDPATAQASAEPAAGGQVRLTGTKMYVVDGQHADIFVVSARSPLGSIGLYVVDANRPEVTVTALSTLDLTRPQARVEFDAAPARPLSDEADAAAVAERAVATAAIMLAAEQVGGAQNAWTWPSSTRRSGCSSAGRSAVSRRSNTSAPTCCSTWNRPVRRPTGRPACSMTTATTR